MSTTQILFQNAIALEQEDKLRLIDQLLLSMQPANREVDKRWAMEAESRIDAYDNHQIESVPVSEVLSKYKTCNSQS